ncbi:uncharacterized protein LOC111796458 isoform X1 [Cucurbita pepo subsp. pepo]|uniref:uncharacterized protein LOC111796458 isoform X1 n=1 Tax=Cucurbita pepo subsp. pepo TaxID=3664 RepID=UPI000C9D91F3|nr:uncharacterized protein LOC111796458 isoform X1 [Cucurbita pepo subsp. pepo]XP_023534836.1 uncharacterized protein LOC111796458 isoform X1 [Cucurbita pepo subsp. pepo]XP_023534837.1 uncharacterized protein LOC111796458 isoform X1 [Cucurbita pepo subsp. pepo]
MIEIKEKPKKGTISNEDSSAVLERYSVRTIFTLLREVAHVSEVRIDWDKLVKNTSTGISNVREYQLLWRHLAYRHTLLENVDSVTDPLDYDSDLDFEIEPFPSVSNESLNEAAACVKVLIANGIPSESDVPSSSVVEAPLTIGISSNSRPFRASLENPQSACLMQGMYVTFPISVQRQPLPTPSATEVFDVNGAAGGNAASRKRRKPWSKTEDLELMAAVEKYGEGNWANILKADFKGDRTASQLSQRWSIIRKRRGKLSVGANTTSTQTSKAQIDAAHRALSLALDLPVNNSKSAANSNMNSSTVSSTSGAEAPVQIQNQSPQVLVPLRPLQVKPLPSAAKSGINTAKNTLMMKSTHNSDSIVRATAVAAGARIVSPSDAASLMKAAQTKNAIHIKSKCVSSIQPPVLGNASTHLDARPSVHYISTGRTATPGSNYVGGKSTMAGKYSMKYVSPKAPYNCSTAVSTNPPSNQISPTTESPLKQEVKSSEECKISKPIITSKDDFRENRTVVRDVFASQISDWESGSRSTCIENQNTSLNMEIDENDIKAACPKQDENKTKANDVKIRG